MSNFDMQSKFPSLTPMRSTPTLFTINGCGFTMSGARNFDSQTGTYVATHVICLIFIPVFCLGAFRVAASPQGWYFIGREPLSSIAKLWNLLVLGAAMMVVLGIGFLFYADTPGYRASRILAHADRLVAEGKAANASHLYREVAAGNTRHAQIAQARIEQWLAQADLQPRIADVLAMFREAGQLQRQNKWPPGREALVERGRKLVSARRASDPRGAMQLLDVLEPLAGDRELIAAERLKALERLVVVEPKDVDALSKLAVLYETSGDRDKCESLLEPLADLLGSTEGARILGEIRASQGKLSEAHKLLLPYCDDRLTSLHRAEQQFELAFKSARERCVQMLQMNAAPPEFYVQYKAANAERQTEMVRQFVEEHVKTDSGLKIAREAVTKEATIVPVALSLGMLMLRRGQDIEDPVARKPELEKAERMFLAVRGIVGESKEYRLHLGQVKHWLGKHAEGQELFDALLAAEKRDFETLLAVSRILREVGEITQARAIAEEAYGQEVTDAQKHQAASLRAVLYTDLEDQVKWLERCDPADPHTVGSLSQAQGLKALQAGKHDEAAGLFRAAVQAHLRQTETMASLNNAALAALQLYRVSKNQADFEQGVALMEKAIAQAPGNSLLLQNASGVLLDAALREIIGQAIDLNALQQTGTLGHLRFLYRDEAGRRKFVAQVKAHPGIARALEFLDRSILLAPKNLQNYRAAAELRAFLEDEAALTALSRRIKEAQPSANDQGEFAWEIQSGQADEKYRRQMQGVIGPLEAILKSLGPDRRDATFATAQTSLIHLKMMLDRIGDPIDVVELLPAAEAAYAAAPSVATQEVLGSVLALRACKSLALVDANFAALVRRHGRELSPEVFLALGLSQAGTMRDTMLANEDVKRLQQLALDDCRNFPNGRSSWQWAILRHSHPAETAEIAKGVKVSDSQRLRTEINRQLAPTSVSHVVQTAWDLELAGKTAEAAELLKPVLAPNPPEPVNP